MFRHFHAKSLEIAKQNSERLPNFSPHEPRIRAHGPTLPRAVGEYEYRNDIALVYTEYIEIANSAFPSMIFCGCHHFFVYGLQLPSLYFFRRMIKSGC